MIQNCKFVPDGEGKFICPDCGLRVPRDTLQANCKVKNKGYTPPSLPQRLENFSIAAVKHAVAGNPIVPEEVRKERVRICKECPLFKPNDNDVGGVCTHSSCGCNIKDNQDYLNKVNWADQKCPVDRWGVYTTSNTV